MFLFVVVILFVLALLAEMLLRIMGVERLAFTNPDLYQKDDMLSYVMKANHKAYSHGCDVTTNAEGFRGPSFKRNNQKKVLFLGDSVTFGFGVDEDEGFVSRFTEGNSQKLLGINFGVCGFSLLLAC